MGARQPVYNTFGELVIPHVKAIENEYESYVAAFSTVQQYLRRSDLSSQPKEPTSKRFMHLVMTPYCKHAWNELIPAEFAVVIFSVDKGVEKSFVGLVDSGEIPLGERGEVVTNCNRNALPFPGDFDAVDANSTPPSEVLKTIEEIANKWGCNLGNEILIFAMRSEIGTLTSCIRWLERKYPCAKWRKFRILTFEMLLMALSELVENAGNNGAVIRHEGGAARFLYHSRYEYNPALACCWHQKQDNIGKVPYCALNIVLRRAYNALYYLCHLFGKAMKPNNHVPIADKHDVIDRELKKQFEVLMNEDPIGVKREEKPMVKYEVEENVFKVKYDNRI
ncbi:unnamed protein product [Orchesella dallaii]|uniref:Maelstrom domain-containing protein n=1 Tax=Orchesella dallaii TaxID=48710 RepID=A0ABP1RF01_9HEXA